MFKSSLTAGPWRHLFPGHQQKERSTTLCWHPASLPSGAAARLSVPAASVPCSAEPSTWFLSQPAMMLAPAGPPLPRPWKLVREKNRKPCRAGDQSGCMQGKEIPSKLLRSSGGSDNPSLVIFVIPTFGRLKQENCREFEVSLGYVLSTKPAGAA